MKRRNLNIKETTLKEDLKVGRPRLEDKLILDAEMERFASELSSGFTPIEAAERMGISADKALKYAINPVILERVDMLHDNPLPRWERLRDELYEAVLLNAIERVKEGQIPWHNLQWWIERLEEQKDIYITSRETTKKVTKKETEMLPENTGSIFTKETIHEKKEKK